MGGKKCQGGSHDGADVYLEYQGRECQKEGGVVVPKKDFRPDGGPFSPERTVPIHQLVIDDDDLASPEGDKVGIALIRQTLLTFPLCEINRRFPDSPIVTRLAFLDEDQSSELTAALAGDANLRREVLDFVLNGSAVAASALAAERTDNEFTLTDDIFDYVQALGEKVSSKIKDRQTIEAISDALRLAQAFRGLPQSGILPALSSDTSEPAITAD